MCKHNGCKKQSYYNFEGLKNTLFCSEHKQEGMVDIKSKRCEYDGCKTQPTFNFEGQKMAIFCSKHKQVGMIDVKSKTCEYDGCKTRPTYNFEGQKMAIFCAQHKQDGMVDIKHKTCQHEGCKTRPTFNFDGQKDAIFCSEHKQDGMVDVVSKTCKYDWCSTRVSDKYEGYCLRCFIHTFPDKPVSRNYKTKEYSVVEFVKQTFPELTLVTDKKVQGGCSRKRPDILLDLGYQIIIVEIDENQHIDYDCSCENKRMMELSQDLGHRPIIFIRFNPDDYLIKNKNITSCWGQDKKGICVVKKSKTNEWNERLKELENQINYWLRNNTNKTIETIHLFYDL